MTTAHCRFSCPVLKVCGFPAAGPLQREEVEAVAKGQTLLLQLLLWPESREAAPAGQAPMSYHCHLCHHLSSKRGSRRAIPGELRPEYPGALGLESQTRGPQGLFAIMDRAASNRPTARRMMLAA